MRKIKKGKNWLVFGLATFMVVTGLVTTVQAAEIVHDAEYYILEKQNGEKWAKEDKSLDKKLAEFTRKNGGKPPNIFYILIDDIGFGDLGDESLNSIRG